MELANGYGRTPNFEDYASVDSSSSTPFGSPTSSLAASPATTRSYFYSCPVSPIHHAFSLPSFSSHGCASETPAMRTSEADAAASAAFEFHGRAAVGTDSMISADEIFHNGKIRPLMKIIGDLQNQRLSNLDCYDDFEEEVEHRREKVTKREIDLDEKPEAGSMMPGATRTIPDSSSEQSSRYSSSSSSSPSSTSSRSASRNSQRWTFLKDFLHRRKSDGRSEVKEKFWHSISFSPSSTKLKPPLPQSSASPVRSPAAEGMNSEQLKTKLKSSTSFASTSAMIPGLKRPSNGLVRRVRAPALMPPLPQPPKPNGQRRTGNQEQPEEMRHRSSLTYRQGFNGCSVFGSWGYSAIHGYAKSLNPLSSR